VQAVPALADLEIFEYNVFTNHDSLHVFIGSHEFTPVPATHRDINRHNAGRRDVPRGVMTTLKN